MTPRSILIVDDEASLRELLGQLLANAGYQVTEAEDGRKAGALLKEQTFELVITDIIMPERDGLEFLAEIHRKHPGLRVIAMTGGGHIPREQYVKLAKSLGAHTVLEKPFGNDKLLAAVAAALAG